MRRRTFVGSGTAALAAAVTAGCGGSGSEPGTTEGARTSSTPIGTKSGAVAADLAGLAKDLDGSPVHPGDEAWAAARGR